MSEVVLTFPSLANRPGSGTSLKLDGPSALSSSPSVNAESVVSGPLSQSLAMRWSE
jgi:hypothetical protein